MLVTSTRGQPLRVLRLLIAVSCFALTSCVWIHRRVISLQESASLGQSESVRSLVTMTLSRVAEESGLVPEAQQRSPFYLSWSDTGLRSCPTGIAVFCTYSNSTYTVSLIGMSDGTPFAPSERFSALEGLLTDSFVRISHESNTYGLTLIPEEARGIP